jgi:hypothetical protein
MLGFERCPDNHPRISKCTSSSFPRRILILPFFAYHMPGSFDEGKNLA